MPEKPVFTGFFAFLDLYYRFSNMKNAPDRRAILLFSIPSQNDLWEGVQNLGGGAFFHLGGCKW